MDGERARGGGSEKRKPRIKRLNFSELEGAPEDTS